MLNYYFSSYVKKTEKREREREKEKKRGKKQRHHQKIASQRKRKGEKMKET